MRYAETILPEFDAEMANTRKVLACVPDDKLSWQAHPTLHTIGWNASHLAEIPGWVDGVLNHPSWDVVLPNGEMYQTPQLTSQADILAAFDQNAATARKAILAIHDDAALNEMWSLTERGKPLFTLPRAAVIRTFVFSHSIHHRAHLCVYLRLNEIAVPPLYGG